jgi:hypothetical protein
VTPTVRTAALAAVIVVCAALTTACGGHTGAADGGGQPAATVTQAPSATDSGPRIAELTRIVDAAQSAAAVADSDAAKH